ncbi:MAG: glycoside hydrolase family 172 protein [Planctomycetaceae bacterium]|nr:DUF2961 domain-containing protein [Planctomycetaceae bacterium]
MDLFRKGGARVSRWASFENPSAAAGAAGRANRGAKGSPCASLAAGQTLTLLDVQGSGLIGRIWLTLNERSPETLRACRLEMWWDGQAEPAVAVPLSDFFGVGLGRMAAFESELFANPEGRNFLSFVPMPFRRAARIAVTNESPADLTLFYDVELLLDVPHDEDVMYLHAYWRRERPNALGANFEILPRVEGAGRFLGCNIGVIVDSRYQHAWFGEGEVKMWLDGDSELPTICGTGLEDYVGTSWGLGKFAHRVQGCPIAEADTRQYCFYRYHTDSPIYFYRNCRVAIQTIGGSMREHVVKLQHGGVPLVPVTCATLDGKQYIPLMERATQPTDAADASLPDGWYNFFRQDDWSATAYVYLDRPGGCGAPLAPPDHRTGALRTDIKGTERADV